MTGAISTIQSPFGTIPSIGAPSTADSTATSSAALLSSPLRNPQVIQDPVAGFITQYIDSGSGIVMSQAPSAAIVAYLRQGLSASGLPRAAQTAKTA